MFRLTAALALFATPLLADAHVGARVTGDIQNREGEIIGSTSIFETASGIVRIIVTANGISPGTHGVHLHEVGECEGDFTSAGGHIAGDANHGLVEGGPHPGDLPNAYVQDDGALAMEAFAVASLSVEEHLRDPDGAALIIHAGPDDYESQPSGAAGDRVACAVLNLMPE
ncbi:superoxide dismutase family protein [Jannaschia aquimarina]|uniref:SodC protein n=1 Tax=Jannaschia aquimarina TaxID=935700 RepID=A0A0D1EAE8_9RHOB|nr:superoxide dismutase family protein [Jannaschia aquimarina]KIT14669.1 Superoxide dismutase [Cu-Zn] precursor [Jannaschia aquimarina]SNT37910.1 superoxide dismutase, Cu-Zn family [Jannaschia aquimarina]